MGGEGGGGQGKAIYDQTKLPHACACMNIQSSRPKTSDGKRGLNSCALGISRSEKLTSTL